MNDLPTEILEANKIATLNSVFAGTIYWAACVSVAYAYRLRMEL